MWPMCVRQIQAVWRSVRLAFSFLPSNLQDFLLQHLNHKMGNNQDEEDETKNNKLNKIKKSKELGISCMLNTEVGAVLAVIRRKTDFYPQYIHPPDETFDSSILHSLKTLRSLIFNPQQVNLLTQNYKSE